jgi:uncharacterized protein YecE (DUF72 family)
VRVRCGTSGFSYPAWKGSFYPKDAKSGDFLGLYAARLPAVEINNTFYRMPTAALLAGWGEQVPAGFSFALKGPQAITHRKRLREASQETAHFHAVAAALGPSLGPVLWQLPPNLKKDLPRLEAFLALLPEGSRPALEFRHESWLADDVSQALRAHGAALVVTHDGERETPLVPTAGFGYLRLRAPDYPPPALRAWAERILAQPWAEAWVFFKHEDEGKGPALAQAMREVLGAAAV